MPNEFPPDEPFRPEIKLFDPAPQPIAVNYARRRMVMRYVSEQELDAIASLSGSVNLTFFGVFAGVFASFLGVILSSDLSDPTKHATCVAVAMSAGALTIFFAICGVRDYLRSHRKLNELKRGGES